MAIKMTRAEYEAKYGTPPVAPVQNAPIKMTRAEYDAKYANKPFTYDVPEIVPTVEDKATRLANARKSAADAAEEARKANSFTGMAKNFSKAFGSTIASSEVGLGKSLQKIYGNQGETYSNIIGDVTSQQVNLNKAIKEKEAKGGDATSLKRIYNDNVKQLAELNNSLKEENTLPTTGEVAGQLGGTALDILTAGTYKGVGLEAKALKNGGVPAFRAVETGMKSGQLSRASLPFTKKVVTSAGLPELGNIATQKASGIFTKQGAKNIGTGFGIGYASDVTQGLQGFRGEDRTGGKAFIPGLGSFISTTIPAISEINKTRINLTDPVRKADKLVEKRSNELNKLDKYKNLTTAVEKGNKRGIDVKKVLSETDVLHNAVDDTGHIATKGEGGAVELYTKEFIDGNEGIVSDLLKKEARSVSPALVEARLNQAVMESGIQGKALTAAKKGIKDEVAGYMLRADANGNIPVEVLHNAKIDKYNNINFFTEGNTKQYDKTVASSLKKMVQDNTSSADIEKINKELSKHFAVIDYLNKLDGKKVDGGKLGKYFAQTTGAIIGSHFGPLGAIAGAEAGGQIKGQMMKQAFRGKTGKVQPQAEAITEALRVKNAPPLQLPQSSNSLGNLKTNQTTTIIPTNNGISKSIPLNKGIVNIQSIKVTDNLRDKVSKELLRINTTPLTVNGKPFFQDVDKEFRLMQLQDQLNTKKPLTAEQIKEAIPLLKELGSDVLKESKLKNAGSIATSPLGLGAIGATGVAAGIGQYQKNKNKKNKLPAKQK